MGIIYKIKPEVKEFIVNQKKSDPALSCRSLVDIVTERFKTHLSKSSINSIIKESGMSMPVGRRQKKKRQKFQMPPLPQLEPKVELPPVEKIPEKLIIVDKIIEPPPAAPVEPIMEKPLPPPVIPPPIEPPPEKIELPVEPVAQKIPEEPLITPVEKAVDINIELPIIEKEPEKPIEVPPVEKSSEKVEEIIVEAPKEEIIQPEPVPVPPPPQEEIKPIIVEKIIEPPPIVPPEPIIEKIVPPPVIPQPIEPPLEKIELPVEPPAQNVPEEPLTATVDKAVDINSVEMPQARDCSGAILLKAADYLLGGSYYIAEAIKNRLIRQESDTAAKIESLIYMSFFELARGSSLKDFSDVWSVVDKQFSLDYIISYLVELKEFKAVNLDILRILSNILQGVRCVRILLPDGSVFYLDGQMHTTWSTPHTPYDFSTSLYNIKSSINRYLQKDVPFTMFMAPGYDTPSKELFDFMLNFGSADHQTLRFVIYGNKFEEIEVLPIEKNKRIFFCFALWPWQYVSYRKVKAVSEFRKFSFEPLNTNLYVADTEIELLQPATRQIVTLRGAVLKKDPNEKARLVVLSNLSLAQARSEDIATYYLNHWPNLDEAFKDFSRKIELFTYTADSQRFFSTDNLTLNKDSQQDIKSLFSSYVKILDSYVKWNFLPAGYETRDFSTMNQYFYNLRAKLEKSNNLTKVTFQLPTGYPFLRDLEYCLRRINEKEIIFADGSRLWLTCS